MICLALDGPTIDEDRRLLEGGMDCVKALELRADMLDLSSRRKILEVMDFPSQVGLPVILTIRRKADGGRYAGSEEDRKRLLKELSQASFSFVDMEMDLNCPSLEFDLMAQGKGIIRSFHDFSGGIPRDMPELARAVHACGEIPKIAVTPRGTADLLELFRLGRILSDIPQKILIGMGRHGLPSRILYRLLGGMMTFASASDPNGIGIPTPQTLAKLYHADDITEDTVLHAMADGKEAPKASSANEAFVPFIVDDRRAFLQLRALLGMKD